MNGDMERLSTRMLRRYRTTSTASTQHIAEVQLLEIRLAVVERDRKFLIEEFERLLEHGAHGCDVLATIGDELERIASHDTAADETTVTRRREMVE